MTQRHAKSRARRYSRRDHEIKTQRAPSRVIFCLKCGDPMVNRGSEYCDDCELRHASR